MIFVDALVNLNENNVPSTTTTTTTAATTFNFSESFPLCSLQLK